MTCESIRDLIFDVYFLVVDFLNIGQGFWFFLNYEKKRLYLFAFYGPFDHLVDVYSSVFLECFVDEEYDFILFEFSFDAQYLIACIAGGNK